MRASITSCISAVLLLGAQGCEFADPVGDTHDPWRMSLTQVTDSAGFCGRVVYLEFWGSWCRPCAQSLPAADRLRAALRPRDFDVVGINLDEERSDADAFLERHPVSFPMVRDPRGESLTHFGIHGVPTAILLDRNGAVRHRIEGYTDASASQIRDWVFELVREPARGACT